ncbi:MAG: signal recognition particle-docking protein FtsY [Nitrospirota bacterium]
MNWVQRLTQGLAKTRSTVRSRLDRLIGRGPDPSVLEELEAALIQADLGIRTVQRLMEQVREEVKGRGPADGDRVLKVLQEAILDRLSRCEGEPIERLVDRGPRPFVILAVGINGVGKTTTVAKLAQRLRQGGRTPLLVAGDTFRAAAIEQLEIWAGRIGAEVVRHKQGADPAAVVYDGLAAARARAADAVLIDTAGRLHTKINLMDELKKVKRILARELPGAPHEALLVLDATAGQNALAQARQFHEAVGVTGIALTKLDGTARGGIVVAIAEEFKIPIRLIGVGEAVEDLQDFRAKEFVEALFARDPSSPVA